MRFLVKIDTLEEDTFAGFQFEKILIRHSTLRAIHANAFNNTANYTRQLAITQSRLANEKGAGNEYDIFNVLSGFLNIEQIDLSGNSLQIVPKNAFRSLNTKQQKLAVVNLQENEIREIGNNAFTQLANLEQLALNSNQISRVSTHAFDFFPSSRTICKFSCKDSLHLFN